MGKAENSCHEQFSSFSQNAFRQNYFSGSGKPGPGFFFFFWLSVDESQDKCCCLKNALSLDAINPFPKQQILGSCKLKEFADDNFIYDENGEKFSKWVENAAGKGENAGYQQFLLFPLRFQETCTADM